VRYDGRMQYRGTLLTITGLGLFGLIAWLVPFGWGQQEATIVQPLTESERVTWEGTVIGVLESGNSLAIERTDGSGAFVASLAETVASVPEGPVLLTGIRGGDTCAYRNTVFAGECVPQLLETVIDGVME